MTEAETLAQSIYVKSNMSQHILPGTAKSSPELRELVGVCLERATVEVFSAEFSVEELQSLNNALPELELNALSDELVGRMHAAGHTVVQVAFFHISNELGLEPDTEYQ